MPRSAPGSKARGFTLIELMVVMAIVAIAAGLVSLAIRDPAQTRLENEAARLATLLEAARADARAGGFEVRWVPGTDDRGDDFRFVGLPASADLPRHWLDPRVSAQIVGGTSLTLGPDAILPPQRLVLRLDDQRVVLASDGLSAFAPAPDASAATP
ncbi:MAG: type II secretion system protein [Burkholderiales bacterium]|nr:type II secretion system protein [Burkholderiales bacterium]MDE2397980.1 type II secretion system protein [Burkholderiales bacterium]MDE2456973.1 type II secretion system protein [Burkholderiales bacterium]